MTTTALTASPYWTGTHHAITWPCYCGDSWPTKDELRTHIEQEHPHWEILETEDDSPNPDDYDAVQRWAEHVIAASLRPSDSPGYTPNTTSEGTQANQT
jgi:hypothetical protein